MIGVCIAITTILTGVTPVGFWLWNDRSASWKTSSGMIATTARSLFFLDDSLLGTDSPEQIQIG